MNIQRSLMRTTSIALGLSFSNLAVFTGIIATELVDASGLRFLPSVSYDLAHLQIKSKSSDTSHCYPVGDRIHFDSDSMKDGIYSYKLLLISDASNSLPKGHVVSQKGFFCILAGVTKRLT